MRVLHVVAETPVSFLQHLKDITFIEKRPLKFVLLFSFLEARPLTSFSFNFHRACAERLSSLIKTLELTNIDEYSGLQKVAGFATLVATYEKGESPSSFPSLPPQWKIEGRSLIDRFDSTGFLLILEPYETDTATVANPVFHFT